MRFIGVRYNHMLLRQGETVRRLIAYFVGVLATFEWIHLLGPVLREFIAGKHFREVFFDLVNPYSDLNADWWNGYFFLLLTFAVIPFVVVVGRSIGAYWSHATVPISVLESQYTLEIFDRLARSRLTKKQLYHANRGGQTAYLAKSTSDSPGGKILKNTISCKSIIDGEIVTEKFEICGNDRAVDTIELYKRPLPTSWIATILPDSLVRFLYRSELKLFENVIVKRVATLENMHEYDGPEAHFGLTSLRYPVSNVKITLKFPIDLAPDLEDLNVLLVKENSGRRIIPDEQNDGGIRSYEINLSSFFQCSLHIFWRNKAVPPGTP